MNKRIIFDLVKTQPLGGTKIHGGGAYGIAVFRRLVELYPDKIAVYYDKNKYIDPNALNIIKEKDIRTYHTKDYTLAEAARKECNIVYSPIFTSSDVIQNPTIIFVSTLHGVRNSIIKSDKYEYAYKKDGRTIYNLLMKFDLKKLCSLIVKNRRSRLINDYLMSQLSNNVSFVTVSESSKYAILCENKELGRKDIPVFYSPNTTNDNISTIDLSSKYGKYYLIISANRWIKNAVRAIIALDELFSERPSIEGKVVVAGINRCTDLRLKIKNLHRFVFLGYVDDQMLKSLYKSAYLFIFPSLYEGFGYPPLEAMHEGTPVIASGCSSIPEICGEAVLYFNPYYIKEIKLRILEMESLSIREKYIKRGMERQAFIAKRQDVDLDELCKYIVSFL